MGVASGCGYQEMGVASGSGWDLWVWLAGGRCGWNLWVWLVGACGCKEVYRFPHITYPYSSFICSFLQTPLVSVLFCSSIPTFC